MSALETLIRDARNVGGATLEQRIAQLEDQVGEIASQPTPDSLTPNLLHYDPATKTFSPTIPPALAAEDDPNSFAGTPIQWVRQTDGSTVAKLLADVSTTGQRILDLQALGVTGQYAQVNAQAILSGGAGGEGAVTLIDSNQASNLVQIDPNTTSIGGSGVGFGRMTLAAGSGLVSWPGTSNNSNSAIITAVRFTNSFAFLAIQGDGFSTPQVFFTSEWISPTNPAQVHVQALSPNFVPAGGVTATFFWIAVGW